MKLWDRFRLWRCDQFGHKPKRIHGGMVICRRCLARLPKESA